MSNDELINGTSLSVVYHAEGNPHFITATVCGNSPLVLEGTNCEPAIVKGSKLLLVSHNDGGFAKATGQCLSFSQTGSKVKITVGQLEWESGDRRRYPRYPVSAHIDLRGVAGELGNEQVSSFEGVTFDLSLGGAWIESDAPLPNGSLVNVEARISSQEIVRVLGVVAWSQTDKFGFGVEFLDFRGSSRYHLHEFLTRQAA